MDQNSSFKRFSAIISGRVQGVAFRYSTVQSAAKYKVYGWVRNKSDGSVELECEGPEENVIGFLKWLETGPVGARVRAVHTQELPYQGYYKRFSIEY